MGYTHYWYVDKEKYLEDRKAFILGDFEKDIKKIISYMEKNKDSFEPYCPGPLLCNHSGVELPIVEKDTVFLNGNSEFNQDYESFIWDVDAMRPTSDLHSKHAGQGFDFCKTAHKPYDTAVCAILLYLKNKCPKSITLYSDSDGVKQSWNRAAKVLFDSLGLIIKVDQNNHREIKINGELGVL